MSNNNDGNSPDRRYNYNRHDSNNSNSSNKNRTMVIMMRAVLWVIIVVQTYVGRDYEGALFRV